MITYRGTDSAKIIQVIETKGLRGDGTNQNPVRVIIQYWDFEGNLLAERDNYKLEKESLI